MVKISMIYSPRTIDAYCVRVESLCVTVPGYEVELQRSRLEPVKFGRLWDTEALTRISRKPSC